RTGTSLIHIDDELVTPLATEHFVRRGDDCVGEPRFQAAGFLVRQRCRTLDAYNRIHERREWTNAADREVLDRAQRLHAVHRVGRYGELAQWVLLNPRCV